MDVPAVPAEPEAEAPLHPAEDRIGADTAPSGSFLAQLSPGIPLGVAASALRERIYGSIACLSTLLVITGDQSENHPWVSVVDVLVATGGLWTASVLAEVVAHLGAHGGIPVGKEVRHILWVSGQIMAASAVPLVLLVLSALHVLSPHTALWSGVWVLVAEMGLFAFLTVRRTPLTRWGRTGLIAALVMLGLLVVGLKTLAH